ncbi:MAG: transposase, partial [Candidatus Omnitrophica bacterium]|nr:transposase [Candidatus Omnitrophota bacterium]
MHSICGIGFKRYNDHNAPERFLSKGEESFFKGRNARLDYPGLVYHVINRGNNREIVFVEDEDYLHFLNCIQRTKKKYSFKLFAFCLMTNHIHLLIKTNEGGGISRIMQSLTVAHTRWYNYKYQRCGHVWQGRFNSPVVSEDEHFLKVMRYIEQNPMRAGMVGRIDGYRWSSYKLNTRLKDSRLIDRADNVVFENLGDDLMSRTRAYKIRMREEISQKELDQIRLCTRRGAHYLSERVRD